MTDEELREMVTQMSDDVRIIRTAVVGNKDIGVPGLVEEVASLKKWRHSLDIRIAGISGGIVVVMAAVKWYFAH